MIQTHVPQQTASKSGDKRRNRQKGKQTDTMTMGQPQMPSGTVESFPLFSLVYQQTAKVTILQHVKA